MLYQNLNKITTVLLVSFLITSLKGQQITGSDATQGTYKFNKQYLLQENFEDNSNDWAGFNVQNKEGSINFERDGRFVMTSLPGKSTFIVNQTNLSDNDNFELSLEFKFLNPSNAVNSPLSLSWGVSFANSAQYVISIAPSGILAYRMLSQENEKQYLYEDIVNQFEPDASNRIEIKKISEQYNFYINGHLIGQSPFEQLFGNGIIITCGSNLSAQLSRFTIARLVEPKKEINLPPRLSIESPELNDSEIYETEEDKIHIDGIVSDENGIRSITINGLNTPLQNQRFNLDLSLVNGRNVIKIIATDHTGNQSVKHFEVIRREPVENFIAGQRRLAVVIGNNDYQNAPKLKNPVNDATDMSATLKNLGFDVKEYHNLTYSELIQAVRDYGDAINDYDVTMFFYAGHGMQVDDQNYLLPIDAVCDEKKDVQFEAVEVDKVLRLMVSFDQESLHMLVLDACRNNPFRSWSRGGESGLASMQPPSGTLIAYATSPGSYASDGTGENGLYTNELIKQLQKSQRIEDVFINTRVEVEKKSNGQQSPWELARLRGKYYLK